ncbi:DUF4190 domain-containing protein [Arthrobacter sp. MYb213]|uniref:DUF4190 domain-containing protein n=1 Tax=Arthrobacter sp. MYb213 TaxID=1848595 RepID=UPI001C6132D1|nr:DUF4190 domain-containing protein [Arthrobacter sp. MYb213]
MVGIQGWHLLVLLVVAAVIVAIIVVVVALGSKSSARNATQAGVSGQPIPGPQVGYAMDGQPIYQQNTQPETNVFAILALILGILTGFFGIIFGHLALNQIQRTGQSGRGMALAGLIIGYAWLALWILLILGMVAAHAEVVVS